MIRSRSHIIKLYNNNLNFIWYKSVFNSHEWYMTVSWSLNWKLSWYNKLWVNYMYRLRSFDAVNGRWRYKLKDKKPLIDSKSYINQTKYQVNEMTIWRRIKYGLMFNYATIIEIFVKRLSRLVHFFKNDALLFTTYFNLLVPHAEETFKLDTYEFSMSKKYWNHFIKKKIWSIILYKINVLKYSYLYSVFADISLLPYNLYISMEFMFKFNLTNLMVYNTLKTTMPLFKNNNELDDFIMTDYNWILNDYEFNLNLFLLLEIYKSSILITLKVIYN